MRSSKSILAGLAAGALGVGVLSFVAAPAAQAGSASTVAWADPSLSVVATGMSGFNNPGPVSIPLYLLDSAGDLADDTTNRSVQVTVTAPSTATYDDSVVVSLGGGPAGINVSSANVLDLLSAFVSVNSQSGDWEDLLTVDGVGTYTIKATVINTNNGAVLSTSTLPLQVTSNAGAPAATFSWTNAAGNVIDGIGVDADDSVANQDFVLTNPTGGPYVIIDDSFSYQTSPSSLNVGSPTTSPAVGLYPGVYTMIPGVGSTTGAAGLKSLVGVLTTASTVGTGTLSYQVASVDPAFGSYAWLTTEPQYTTDGVTFQVPPGTKKLDFGFSLTNSAASGTVAWNAVSTATGGKVTRSGGAAAVTVDSGSVSVDVNAAASAVGEAVTFTLGAAGAANAYNVYVEFTAPTTTVFLDAPIAKVSTEAPIAGAVTDQYGNALAGTWAIRLLNGAVSCASTATPIATTTAGADGAFIVKVPAAYALASAGTAQYTVCASNGFVTAGDVATVTFTATGGVSSLTSTGYLTSGTEATALPVVQVPGTGVVTVTSAALTSQQVTASTALTPAVISAAGTAFELIASVNPKTTVTFTGTDGVMFTEQAAGSLLWSTGSSKAAVLATGVGTSGTAAVSVYATKPGTHTVTMTAGSTTTTYAFKAGVARGSTRFLQADPTSLRIAPNEFKAISVKATDIYGNAVPDDTSISAALAGGGSLSAATGATSAAGVLTVYYTAPTGTGNGKVVWTAGTYVSGTIPGVDTAKPEAATDIAVTTGADKTILIVGDRTTVSGKPGIKVEGDTTGFDAGAKMKPWVRFPGQTDYTAGDARPTVSVAGDFTWQRKTGKKTYVFFSSEDDAVKSNRIIIAAK